MSVKVAIPRGIESSFNSSIAMPDPATGEQEWQSESGRAFRSPLMPMAEIGALWDCIYLSEMNKYLSLRSPTLTTYVLEKFNSQGGLEGSVNIPIPSPALNVRSLACSISIDDDPSKCLVSVASKESESSLWVFNFIIVTISSMTVQGQRGIDLGGRYVNDSEIGDFDIKYSGGVTVVTRTQAGEENEIAVLDGGSVISKIPQRHGITKCCIFNGSIYGLSARTILNGDFFDVYKFNIDLDEIDSYRLPSISYDTPKFQFPCLNSDGRFITHAVREVTPESPSGVAVNAQVYNENMINIGSYKRNDEVIKSSTKRKYRCAVEATFDDPELGVNLSPPTWSDVGSVNRFAILDSNTSQRSIFNGGGFVSCSITNPVDTVGVFGLSGVQSATVSVIGGGSTLYAEIKSGMDSEFSDVEIRDLVFSVPPFSNVTIRVDFTGSNVRVGRFAVGVSEAIGRAVPGTELGDIDYSILEFDEFGNTRYVPRPIVSFHTFQVDVDKQKSLSVARKLQSIGGKDAMWSADVGLSEPLVAIGKCERFPITYDNPTIVSYTVKVRGTA